MKRYILTIIIILASIYLMESNANACTNEKPIAVISNQNIQYVGRYRPEYDSYGPDCGKIAYLDGRDSHDFGDPPDQGIVAWYWKVGKWNGSTYEIIEDDFWVGRYPEWTFTEEGEYAIYLWVKDNDDPTPQFYGDQTYFSPDDPGDEAYWSEDLVYCFVHVFSTTISSGSEYSAWGSGKDFTCDVVPDERWTTDDGCFKILKKYAPWELVYYDGGFNIHVDYPPETYSWNGMGNQYPYENIPLPPDNYVAVFEASEKNYLSPNWASMFGYSYYWGWYNSYPEKLFTQIKVDLDIDSDNNNGTGQFPQSQTEDDIEDDDELQGKCILVNDKDADDDGIIDYADGFNFDESSGNNDDNNSSEKFIPIILQISDNIDVSVAKIKITYNSSNPAGITPIGTPPNYIFYTPAEPEDEDKGALRIWTEDGSVSRNKASLKDTSEGDYVEPGTYDATRLGFSTSVKTKTFYVEAIAPSSSLGDARILVEVNPSGSEPEGFICQDAVRLTAFRLALVVFDWYVVLQKSSEIREIPMLNAGEIAGAYDNHMPMTILLDGPTGFSCKVKLSDSGGGTGVGDVIIKKADGSSYSSEGETITAGTFPMFSVKIYGTTASSNLNDVTFTAKTDKTGDLICSQSDLTVIWIFSTNMNFRGSEIENQGDPLTACSSAQFSKVHSLMEDIVGKCIYQYPYNGLFKQYAFYNQMEISIQITPNEVISDVTWDIKREVNRVKWGPGSGTLTPKYLPVETGSGWFPDDSDSTTPKDEDLEQNADCLNIFVNDCPGEPVVSCDGSPGERYAYKAKFREWVQVSIGGKVYVCSPYLYWHSIIHAKWPDETTGWIWDTTKTTEIVTGTLDGWANTWSED